jgi:hypothetical protein
MGVLLIFALQAEGTYTMCREVEGYSGETIELKDGRFRYWFYSDVETGDEPAYPLTGAYTIQGDQLILDHAKVYRPRRTIAKMRGVDVLLRDDAAELLKKENRLHPYGILLKGDPKNRPSIASITSPEMKARDQKEFEDRFADVPKEARELLRAYTARGDPMMDAYKAAIAKARGALDVRLPGQLIGQMGKNAPASIEAFMVLQDLYEKTDQIPDAPAFMEKKESKTAALNALIDGLSSSRDRYALQSPLMLFLRISGARKISLEVPGTGLHVILEAKADGSESYASQGVPADGDTAWKSVMPKLIPACQTWMRERLAR